MSKKHIPSIILIQQIPFTTNYQLVYFTGYYKMGNATRIDVCIPETTRTEGVTADKR